jgi:hypothetical protein
MLDEFGNSRWLLIDWEFAVFISENNEYSIGGTVNTFLKCIELC